MSLLRLLAFALFALSSAAADPASPPVMSVRPPPRPPALTANEADPAWNGVQRHALVSMGTRQDASSSVATWVAAQWDADWLYVRFWCVSNSPARAPHGTLRDAPHHEGDVVEVFLDPAGDGHQFVELQINPLNGVRDVLYLLTAKPQYDASGVLLTSTIRTNQWEFLQWDLAGLRTAASPWEGAPTAAGWIIDAALPAVPLLRRLDQNNYKASLTLRAHFVRYSPAASSTEEPTAQTWSTAAPFGRPHRSPVTMGFLNLTSR